MTPPPPSAAPAAGTDLVYSSASLEQRKDYARALSAAGSLLPKALMEPGADGRGLVPSPGKVLLIAETGNMLGIHPIAALNGVHIIEGKPTIAPALMTALVRQRGHKVRVKVTGSVAGGDIAVTVTLIRADDPEAPFEVTWTVQDAIEAGLVTGYAYNDGKKRWVVTGASGKATWERYTRQMLLHRATGEVCRQGANEVLMGVYTPEELDAAVNSEGELVELPATDVTHRPAAAAPELGDTDAPRFDPDEWLTRIERAGDDVDALRRVYIDANENHANVLEYTLPDGSRVREAIFNRVAAVQERAAQDAAGEPETPAPREPEPPAPPAAPSAAVRGDSSGYNVPEGIDPDELV